MLRMCQIHVKQRSPAFADKSVPNTGENRPREASQPSLCSFLDHLSLLNSRTLAKTGVFARVRSQHTLLYQSGPAPPAST